MRQLVEGLLDWLPAIGALAGGGAVLGLAAWAAGRLRGAEEDRNTGLALTEISSGLKKLENRGRGQEEWPPPLPPKQPAKPLSEPYAGTLAQPAPKSAPASPLVTSRAQPASARGLRTAGTPLSLVDAYNQARRANQPESFGYRTQTLSFVNRTECANDATAVPAFGPHERGRFLLVEESGMAQLFPSFRYGIASTSEFEGIFTYPAGTATAVVRPAIVVRRGNGWELKDQGEFGANA